MADKEPDWERIELDYRAGVKSLRQIAGEQGVSEGAIRKRAKRDDWARDLNAKIQSRADELVRKESVRTLARTEKAISERVLVEASAVAIKDIRLAHRKDIARSRSVMMALLYELECQTGAENVALLQQLGDLMRSENDYGTDRLNDLYHKIISLPERAKTMKALADSLRIAVDLERQAFGMKDESEAQADALASLLNKISGGNCSSFGVIVDDPEH